MWISWIKANLESERNISFISWAKSLTSSFSVAVITTHKNSFSKDSPDYKHIAVSSLVFFLAFTFLCFFSFNSFAPFGVDLCKLTTAFLLFFAFCDLCSSKLFNTPAFLPEFTYKIIRAVEIWLYVKANVCARAWSKLKSIRIFGFCSLLQNRFCSCENVLNSCLKHT